MVQGRRSLTGIGKSEDKMRKNKSMAKAWMMVGMAAILGSAPLQTFAADQAAIEAQAAAEAAAAA